MIDAARRASLASGVAAIYVLLLAPIPVVVLTSFSSGSYLAFPPDGLSLRWYRSFFADDAFVSSLRLSLLLAAVVTVCAVTVGTLAAYSLTRHEFRGKRLLEAWLMTPLFFPHIILAIGLLIVYTPVGLYGTFLGLVLAHVLVTIPYTVRTISVSLAALDPAIEEAALSLGASRVTAFFRVTLPLIRLGLLSSAVLAFLISLDEVVISLFLAGPVDTPLPVRMFTYIEHTSDPTIAAAATLLMAGAFLLVLIAPRNAFRGSTH